MENKLKKKHIGSGKQIGDMKSVEISIKVADALNCMHKLEGEYYMTFKVTKKEKSSNRKNTHSVYYLYE